MKHIRESSGDIYCRDDEFILAENDTSLGIGNKVVSLTSNEHPSVLTEHWHPQEKLNCDKLFDITTPQTSL